MNMSKTILITGATGNIGKELCRYLAKQGNNFILTARNPDKLSKLGKELTGTNKVEVQFQTSDFSDPDSFAPLINMVSARIDGVVLMPPQPPETNNCLPEDHVWENMFKSSFIGPTALIRELIPSLAKRKAAVVLISGISSKQPLGKYATSNVLRTAWTGEMKTLANVYGRKGIRFNTLSLGGVMTEAFKKKIETEALTLDVEPNKVLENKFFNVPLGRYAKIDEIGAMLQTLLVTEASNHITGQNIAFDGGFTQNY